MYEWKHLTLKTMSTWLCQLIITSLRLGTFGIKNNVNKWLCQLTIKVSVKKFCEYEIWMTVLLYTHNDLVLEWTTSKQMKSLEQNRNYLSVSDWLTCTPQLWFLWRKQILFHKQYGFLIIRHTLSTLRCNSNLKNRIS